MTLQLVVGYDGSPEAGAAINVGAALFPAAHAFITYLWLPPFASDKVRRRLRAQARDITELIALIEQEGESEAGRIIATGVTLANAAGWQAESLLQRTWGGEGWRIAQAAEEVDADLVVVGSRGLGGTQALLGSVSDLVVHYSSRPTVVVPHPLLSTEHAALSSGPVIVGWDGSTGSEMALAAAAALFVGRDLLLVSVGDEDGRSADGDELHGHRVLRVKTTRDHGFRGRTTAHALIAAAREIDAAAVVVGSRGRSLARDIVLGSVAMATLHHTERPVMVVPAEWSSPAPSENR